MKICHWLVPGGESRLLLQETIHRLASEYAAPSFVPHITLFAHEGDCYDHRKLSSAVRDLVPVTVFPVRAAETDLFTKTVFLEFAESPELDALAQTVRLNVESDYEFHAHLSLIYAALDRETRQAIA